MKVLAVVIGNNAYYDPDKLKKAAYDYAESLKT